MANWCELRIVSRRPGTRITNESGMAGMAHIRSFRRAKPDPAQYFFLLAAAPERRLELHGVGHDLTRQAIRRAEQLDHHPDQRALLEHHSQHGNLYRWFGWS